MAAPKTILIYQMGKVGSRSIERSLLAADLYRSKSAADIGLDEHIVAHVHSHAEARELINAHEGSDRELLLVTLTRDLLPRALSVFMQNSDNEKDNHFYLGERDAILAMSTEELIAAFRDRFDAHMKHTVEPWFDRFETSTGINVFDHKMSDRGFKQVPWDRGKAAVIRMENLSDAGDWLRKFFGMPKFQLARHNETATKWNAEPYKRLQAAFRPTPVELDRVYNSRFMEHFYTPDQIRRFRARWTGVPDAAAAAAPPAV